MKKDTQREARKGLLTIGEACQVLGVSEVTLRQWTDEGKVKAFITPGGHRRYPEAELKQLLGSTTAFTGSETWVTGFRRRWA